MTYLDITDRHFYSVSREILLDKGKRLELVKGDYLCRQGEKSAQIGLLVSGSLKYTSLTSNGNERILSFAFTGDLVGCYSAMRNKEKSLFDIVALESSVVYQLPIWELDTVLSGRSRVEFDETLSYILLQKVIDDCCLNAEERYVTLSQRFPDIHNRMTNRTIAAYLGVTPESLCRLRKRLLTTKKI
ncbi:MAG: Crp/Fnr family transcriptional regulator [Muribaculaceae bacterium]|nr:Crp/Fnr family transcriptional regulator [Muribaculaceae bacterium]MBR6432226.1 Crp/Fnr family transcriptional regulator [Muribaculaceae bacterium]